jgi:Zn-dependent protease with chaperone function
MEAAARHAHMLTGTEVKVFPVDDRVCGNGILYYAPGRPYLMCVNTGFVARHPEALDGLVTHEYGHAVDRSSERKMVTMMLHNAVNSAGLLLGAYCVTTFVEGFLAGSPPLHCLLLMPSVLLAFWWIRFVKPSLNVLMNHASEYAADAHACRVAGLSAAVAALTAFETEPGKRSRHASDTHPSDGDRIAALKKYAERLALATRSS